MASSHSYTCYEHALEVKVSDKSTNLIQDGRMRGRAGHDNPDDGLLGKFADEKYELNVEEYSSAICYRSGFKLFIHYTLLTSVTFAEPQSIQAVEL